MCYHENTKNKIHTMNKKIDQLEMETENSKMSHLIIKAENTGHTVATNRKWSM